MFSSPAVVLDTSSINGQMVGLRMLFLMFLGSCQFADCTN